MNLNKEQINDLRFVLAHYMQKNVSISNPRYKDYEVILQLLNETEVSK